MISWFCRSCQWNSMTKNLKASYTNYPSTVNTQTSSGKRGFHVWQCLGTIRKILLFFLGWSLSDNKQVSNVMIELRQSNTRCSAMVTGFTSNNKSDRPKDKLANTGVTCEQSYSLQPPCSPQNHHTTWLSLSSSKLVKSKKHFHASVP